jgi:hypothetical protein
MESKFTEPDLVFDNDNNLSLGELFRSHLNFKQFFYESEIQTNNKWLAKLKQHNAFNQLIQAHLTPYFLHLAYLKVVYLKLAADAKQPYYLIHQCMIDFLKVKLMIFQNNLANQTCQYLWTTREEIFYEYRYLQQLENEHNVLTNIQSYGTLGSSFGLVLLLFLTLPFIMQATILSSQFFIALLPAIGILSLWGVSMFFLGFMRSYTSYQCEVIKNRHPLFLEEIKWIECQRALNALNEYRAPNIDSIKKVTTIMTGLGMFKSSPQYEDPVDSFFDNISRLIHATNI